MPTTITERPYFPPDRSVVFFPPLARRWTPLLPSSKKSPPIFPYPVGPQFLAFFNQLFHGPFLLQTDSYCFSLLLLLPVEDVQPKRLLFHGPVGNPIPDELPILSQGLEGTILLCPPFLPLHLSD